MKDNLETLTTAVLIAFVVGYVAGFGTGSPTLQEKDMCQQAFEAVIINNKKVENELK